MSPRLPPELSVGFEEIDGQHRHVMRCIEAATAAVDRGDRSEVKETLSALGDYLVAHFSSEEAIMAQACYPERARHKAAHDIFMQDIAQLVQELESSGLSPLVRQWIVARVPEWVRFHIQANDVPLGQFLSSKKFRPEEAGANPLAKPRMS
jgi:hemerythrin